jgi:hypothetical protein
VDNYWPFLDGFVLLLGVYSVVGGVNKCWRIDHKHLFFINKLLNLHNFSVILYLLHTQGMLRVLINCRTNLEFL